MNSAAGKGEDEARMVQKVFRKSAHGKPGQMCLVGRDSECMQDRGWSS